jgi:glycosyltransferase involved in cell wall biosynthesis
MPIKALMIVHSYYPSDPRVRREAEALSARGDKVDVICLREGEEKKHETVRGVNIYRLPVKRHRGSGFLVYLSEYITFFILASFKIIFLHIKNRYQVIQVHTIPDFLIFCALIPKLFGAKVILDMHEVMPEFFMYRYNLSQKHLLTRMVRLQEKLSTKFANHIITVSDTLKDILVSRNVNSDKITVIMNVPDDKIFNIERDLGSKDKKEFIISYHGLISDIYDLKIVLESLALIKGKIPKIKFMVIGKGPQADLYKKTAEKLGINNMVQFLGHMSQERVVEILKDVDVGIVPLVNNDFSELAFPTKVVEYVIMKIPVITADCRTIRRYFNNDSLCFYAQNNAKALADRICQLYQKEQMRNNFVINALECYDKINWGKMKERYYDLLDNILN